jgi:TRAP-type C4-dicarboxylate transport system substrate-binding protein
MQVKSFSKLVIAGLAALCMDGAVAQNKVVLKIADSLPTNHNVQVEGIKVFMDKVSKATNGNVEFQYYPAQQLGKANQMLTLAQTGVTDIAYVLPSYVTDKMPASTVMELPGLFASSCEATKAFMKATHPGGALAESDFKKNGVRVLISFMYQPFDLMTTNRKVEKLADWKGLKIRTAGGSTELALVELGAVPVRMTPPEIYQSMTRGTIDGTLFNITSAPAYDIDDASKFVTTGMTLGNSAVTYLISEQSWKKLSPANQAALVKAGEETSMHLCEYTDGLQTKEVATLRAKGVVVTQLGPAERDLWNQQVARVHQEWAAKMQSSGIAADPLFKAISAK